MTDRPAPTAPTLVPYLAAADADGLLAFYAEVFGAREVERWTAPDGRVGHAELELGGCSLYLADEHPELGVLAPTTRGGTSVSLVLTVADCDAVVERALARGATLERGPADEEHGGRTAWILDPSGHRWSLQTPARVEAGGDAASGAAESERQGHGGYTITRA